MVSGPEEIMNLYIDFLDENEWVYVNNNMYKKSVLKLTLKDKAKLKFDFFFDIDKKDGFEKDFRQQFKRLNLSNLENLVKVMDNSVQFDIRIPDQFKTYLKSLNTFTNGKYIIARYNDLSQGQVRKIIDMIEEICLRK